MNISIIVAMSKNRVIGKDNTMPWHLSDDLKNFKSTTMGKTIIMGRLTYESIGKPLPGRKNIILSRSLVHKEVAVYKTIGQALKSVEDEDEVFIIGGQDIYNQTIDLARKIFITKIDENIQGDKYFPEVNFEDWELVSSKSFHKNENNTHNFQAEIYVKKA